MSFIPLCSLDDYPAWLREQEEKSEQAAAKTSIEALEWEWLEASEELEKEA